MPSMVTAPRNCPALLAPQPGPDTLKETRWAGERLGPLRGVPADRRIGESWEFSTLPGAASRAQGRELSEVLGGPLPFLAKLIDTAAALSIQVHPQDDPAAGVVGKEEAWVILDAAPGAYVLAGVASGIDDGALQSALARAIEDPAHDDALLGALRRVDVARGTILVVPAGTVHAIGPGILLAEIQQPVDCTYRLFDYGSERTIHPEQAAAAWRIDAQPEIWRPHEPPRTLYGRHVLLRIHTRGHVTLAATGAPQLLIAVGGGVHVTGADHRAHTLAHGDLVLHTRDDAQVDVCAGALLVVGSMRSSGA